MKVPASYNVVRHAGCAYALAWALTHNETKGEKGLERAVRLAIAYLISLLKEYENCVYVSEQGRDVGNLGATALLSCALSFAPFRDEYAELYLILRSSLTSAQRDDGSFVCRFNAPPCLPEKGQDYYPGQTILALARYSELGLDSATMPVLIRHAHEYYRKRFQLTPHTGMVLWHADAWMRIYTLSKTTPAIGRPSDYLEFALELVEWTLPYQLRPHANSDQLAGGFCFGCEPGIATAVYVEALIRVYQTVCCERRGKRAGIYRTYVQSGLDFVRRLHISADSLNSSMLHWTFGGTPTSFSRQVFRMDHDQHVITMCLTAMENGMDIDGDVATLAGESSSSVHSRTGSLG
jgi:hypothetical protein